MRLPHELAMPHRLDSVRARCAATLLAALATAALPLAQETPKKKDPRVTELVAVGCLSGRVFTVTGNPEKKAEVVTGPDLTGRSFRLTGPKDVMQDVKAYQDRLVEVGGSVKTSDLAAPPGFTMGRTRVTLGVPQGTDPSRPNTATAPVSNVAVMDATSVRVVGDACPLKRR